MKRYLVFDIGCIECGEGSSVVGFYDTEDEAEQAIKDYYEPGTRWGKEGWHGQHSVEIFDMNDLTGVPDAFKGEATQ